MLRRRMQPQAIIRLGLLFLVFASLSRWLVHPTSRFSEGAVDGATGMLYGLAIGLMLLGIYLKGRHRPTS